MSREKLPSSKTADTLCVCISCEKARLGVDQWDEFNIEALLNPDVQITHSLCPTCQSRLQHSLGLMSKLQAF